MTIRWSRRAVTLLEVVIALGLTAIVTALVFGGGPALSKRFVEGRYQQVARALAWKKLAEIEAAAIQPGKQSGAFGGQFPDMHYDLLVEPAKLAKTSIDGLFRVTLRITRVDPVLRSSQGEAGGELLSMESLLFDRFR